MKRYIIILALLFLLTQSSNSQLLHPFNLDFDIGTKGKLPAGWIDANYNEAWGYKSGLSDSLPKTGFHCLELSHIGSYKPGIYATVIQMVDAKQYKGKKVKFRAAVRVDLPDTSSKVQLWIHVRLPDGNGGFYKDMEKNPIVSKDWKYYEIEGVVDDSAEIVNYGLMLVGRGSAWLDDASFELAGLEAQEITPPKPITAKGIDNITAFTKILGCVRYYYPRLDQSSVKWNKLALTGVEAVENAESPEILCKLLNNLILPIAPGVKIYAQENKPKEIVFTKPANAIPNIVLAWRHIGADIGEEVEEFSSEVVNINKSQRDREGAVIQVVDAQPFRGKKIEFSAMAKANVIEPSGQAQLWLRVDRTDEKNSIMKTMFDNPITFNGWKHYNIDIDVPEDASVIRLGLVLYGEGSVQFDDTRLKIINKGENPIEFNPRNNDFEDSDTGKIVKSWLFPGSAENAGYSAIVSRNNPYFGKQCLIISSDEASRIKLPEEGKIYSCELPGGISFTMPLTAYMDSTKILPEPPKELEEIKSQKTDDFIMTGDDRTSRLAITGLLWNVFEHFGMYLRSGINMDSLLSVALTKAANDKNKDDFLTTLRELAAGINDGQSQVWLGEKEYNFGFPFLWKWLDGRVIVYQTADNSLGIKVGDEILELNGIPIKDAISEKEKGISGKTQSWKILRALAELRVGDLNTKMKMKVKSTNGKVFEVSPERNTALNMISDNRLPEFQEIKKGLFYIDLTRLTENGIKKFAKEIENANGLIFDMRGYAPALEEFLGLFAETGLKACQKRIPIFGEPGRKLISYKIEQRIITPKNPYIKAKIAFLTDERTIGKPEEVLEIVKFYELGDIIGQTTAGTASDVYGFTLPGDYHASIAGALLLNPADKHFYGKGITPTITVTPTLEGIIAGKDEILEKAIEVVSKYISPY